MSDPNLITLLQTTELPAPAETSLRDQFNLIPLPNPAPERGALLADIGHRVRGIVGSGKGKVDNQLLSELPNLEVISVTSAGLDGIDTTAVEHRSIPIFNTSSVLANDVADLAIWLVLGATRGLVAADKFVREGDWQNSAYPLGKTIAGMNIGILGLGHIGAAIALRLETLGANIGYCGRFKKPNVDFPYFADARSLAAWSETMVVSCPATTETNGLIDASVLKALGTDGILINISRGSIVDEVALSEAIAREEIYGAGLDVFANEPDVPPSLLNSNRTIVLPHIGSATDGTRRRMWQSAVEALLVHFELPAIDWATAAPNTMSDVT